MLTAPDLSSFVAARRDESARLVAVGQLPRRRLRISAVPRWGAAGDPVLVTRDLDGSLRVPDLHGYGADDVRSVARALYGSDVVVVPDDDTARALIRLMSRDARTVVDERGTVSSVGHALDTLFRLPASTRFVVLTSALSRSLWAPQEDREGDIEAWREWTGLDLSDLVSLVRSGEEWGSTARAVGHADATVLGAGRSDRSTALAHIVYEACELAVTAWESATATDSIGCVEAASAGSAPLVVPFFTDGRTVRAALSAPCRVKPGKVVFLDATGVRLGSTTLASIVYDDDRGLVGIFESPSTSQGTRSSRSKVWHWLVDQARGEGATGRMVNEPFLYQGSRGTSSRWFRADYLDGIEVPDIPLDISLGGAGY